jgi:hypothetical protein
MTAESVEHTLRQMRASYGSFLDRVSMLDLDPSRVPADLMAYIPYAALWGLADDLEREELVAHAPEEAKADLVRTVQKIDDRLDEWLAGDEARSLEPSAEYISFSAMRMAADFM